MTSVMKRPAMEKPEDKDFDILRKRYKEGIRRGQKGTRGPGVVDCDGCGFVFKDHGRWCPHCDGGAPFPKLYWQVAGEEEEGPEGEEEEEEDAAATTSKRPAMAMKGVMKRPAKGEDQEDDQEDQKEPEGDGEEVEDAEKAKAMATGQGK